MIIAEIYKEEFKKNAFLKNVNFSGFRFSDILLFREYQSRLFRWKTVLGFDGYDFFNKKKSYHNLFLDLRPSWFEDIIPTNIVIADLKKIDVKYIVDSAREYQGYFICLYLNWEIFKNTGEIKKYNTLSHPYEPVFKIISRGGLIGFSTDNKFTIDLKTYLKYDNFFKMPTIEDAFLDFIDLNCTDYPNQEKINTLWADFQRVNILL